jgi:branched-chain amino acid transport system permease protein
MIMFFPKGIMGIFQIFKQRLLKKSIQVEKTVVEKEGLSYEQ